MLTDEELSSLIEALDSNRGSTGSFWQMLKHAEQHGFDLAVFASPGFTNLLNCELGGETRLRDNAEVRSVVLQMRSRLRQELGMAQLTAEEQRNWRWERPGPLRRYRYTGPFIMNGQPGLTPEQVEAIVCHVEANYPEVIRYLRAVRAHNQGLGYNGGPNDRFIIRQSWHRLYLEDAICEIVGEEGEQSIDTLLLEQRLALFPNHKSEVAVSRADQAPGARSSSLDRFMNCFLISEVTAMLVGSAGLAFWPKAIVSSALPRGVGPSLFVGLILSAGFLVGIVDASLNARKVATRPCEPQT